jgi:hypothetical protein
VARIEAIGSLDGKNSLERVGDEIAVNGEIEPFERIADNPGEDRLAAARRGCGVDRCCCGH